ncbi:glutamate-5-semialdehyde dehydrogenase [Alginatibacterium sediminis]|uniref:Gamma-glutamyl phosphate reductase n=1 Tax=Alginatibacterium sediminis TaxID=2164068 RepID=A0A420E8Z3_9ALTE|nr:glutamate-5-semialdehyde dehydrogenase [Alginatibacterium sediminis]RKF15754.1 glutamate-5-semialdehyde dehydrogenase [Alginatibacterium sediminis]
MQLEQLGQQAQQASYVLSQLGTQQKNAALQIIADQIIAQQSLILKANAIDIAAGEKAGLAPSLLDRLLLTGERLEAIAADVRMVTQLEDPVGQEFEGKVLENGLRLSKRRIPVGVLGVIYEARPNVTIDIAALALKTGNAAILRGGKETLNSNLVLVKVIQEALNKAGLPETAIQYIESPDRAYVTELLKLDQYVDMIIPRGGAGLHRLCKEQATIPVITGGIGICHVFVDSSAKLDKAVDIIENAKVQRPSVCNALDTILLHRDVAETLLPLLAKRLTASSVNLKADPESFEILQQLGYPLLEAAKENDFDMEWMGLTLGVKIVDDLAPAIAHIRAHSTQHSDSILTEDWSRANRFISEVNSAAVYVNASTRFTDGSQFGLGAEVAVSTQKLHARGPMGLKELTTYKWIGLGDYLIRE